mgnify:FL=1
MTDSNTNFGFIYFMTERDLFGYQCGSYVKIGLVKGNDDGRSSLERRKEHQTGNPRRIVVEEEVKTFAQVSTLESLVHQRLAKNRIHGEWFNYGEEGISSYVDLTREINNQLENNVEDEKIVEKYLNIEDNGEEVKASSESEDIYNDLLEIKHDLIKFKTAKEMAVLKLKSFDQRLSKDIDGICSYEKSKPSEKFEKIKFQKDYPDIVEKIGTFIMTQNLTIKKDIKQKRNQTFRNLEEIIKSQKFIDEHSERLIKRNDLSAKLHKDWLNAHVALQPLELKKKSLENKLKIIVGENQAIKNICSWKRRKKKQINKSDLIKYDSELAKKYISIGNAVIKFKVNDFRPYTF